MVRTRIAPSPTGEDIHIGNLYTALMNYAWAKKNEGHFIVRIEDTDRDRYVKGAQERILSSIKDYGLAPDESPEVGGPFAPYRQSERLPLYKKYADELIAKEKAYYCFCTKERLDELRKQQLAEKKTPRYDKHCLNHVTNADERVKNGESYVIRLNVPQNESIIFSDLIRGDITFDSSTIDDQVLIKSDGYPTYHMAVVVDDHLMEISHVIRAEEWISSTPKHVLLYQAFGWDLPIFAHLPILRNPDKSKLSKRKNPVWARWYLNAGFLPEAVLNYLALMGWSHPEEKEIFSLDEFIQLFELKDIKPVGPVFDLVKLTWLNQQYIMALPNEDYKDKLLNFYNANSLIIDLLENRHSDTILEITKTRIKTLKEFLPLVQTFFNKPDKNRLDKEYKELVPKLIEVLEKIPKAEWEHEKIMEVLLPFMKEHRSAKTPVFYVMFTGESKGLPINYILEILDKNESIDRLKDLVD